VFWWMLRLYAASLYFFSAYRVSVSIIFADSKKKTLNLTLTISYSKSKQMEKRTKPVLVGNFKSKE